MKYITYENKITTNHTIKELQTAKQLVKVLIDKKKKLQANIDIKEKVLKNEIRLQEDTEMKNLELTSQNKNLKYLYNNTLKTIQQNNNKPKAAHIIAKSEHLPVVV